MQIALSFRAFISENLRKMSHSRIEMLPWFHVCFFAAAFALATIPDYCMLKPERGFCDEELTKYYYSPKSKKCLPFLFYGCGGNQNRFDSETKCAEVCKVQNQTGISGCELQPKRTKCKPYQIIWFYDQLTQHCQPYSKGSTLKGCEGNENSFPTEFECMEACANVDEI